MGYYGKAILSCYKKIDAVNESIENLIKKKALSSFYDYSSLEKQAVKLIELSEVRKDLLELKSICESALKGLEQEDRILIGYKYFSEELPSKDYDHTSRNYFRHQVRALNRFELCLKNVGCTEEWFLNKYMKIAFVSNAYKRAEMEEGKKHCQGEY